MLDQSIHFMLQEADYGLTVSEQEMSRPDEDVVTFAVCHTSRASIRKLLASYVAYHFSLANPSHEAVVLKLQQLTDWEIGRLLKRCVRLDGRFANLDLTPLNCRNVDAAHQEDIYCLS